MISSSSNAITRQNVINLVDMAMVGTLGDAALAAVGLGGFLNLACLALLVGLSISVQATAARRKGEGRFSELAVALNGGLLILLVIAPPLSALLYFSVPTVYAYLNTDPDVVAQGVAYLQACVLAMFFAGAHLTFRGYWNGIDRAWIYFRALLFTHAANILLSWVLIFGNLGAPALGVQGAGIASALSSVVGFCICFWLGVRHASTSAFMRRAPSRSELGLLIRLSVPPGIQQLSHCTGFVVMFWILGHIGTRDMAAATAILNITQVALLLALGLGLAGSTLVSEALGCWILSPGWQPWCRSRGSTSLASTGYLRPTAATAHGSPRRGVAGAVSTPGGRIE